MRPVHGLVRRLLRALCLRPRVDFAQELDRALESAPVILGVRAFERAHRLDPNPSQNPIQ